MKKSMKKKMESFWKISTKVLVQIDKNVNVSGVRLRRTEQWPADDVVAFDCLWAPSSTTIQMHKGWLFVSLLSVLIFFFKIFKVWKLQNKIKK